MPANLQDFVNRLLASVPVLDQLRDLVEAGRRVPGLEDALAQVRAEKGVAEEQAVASLQPLADALDAMRGAMWPEAEASPDVTPVTAVEDVPAVLDGTLDPGVVDGRSDAPAADASTGAGGVAEQGDVETQS